MSHSCIVYSRTLGKETLSVSTEWGLKPLSKSPVYKRRKEEGWDGGVKSHDKKLTVGENKNGEKEDYVTGFTTFTDGIYIPGNPRASCVLGPVDIIVSTEGQDFGTERRDLPHVSWSGLWTLTVGRSRHPRPRET